MFADKETVQDYKGWWLSQGHTLTSTLMYVSVIRRFVGDGIEINQKTVDSFREDHMNTVSSGALKSFFRFLVRKKDFDDSILSIRFDRNKQTKRFPKSISYIEVQNIINHMPTRKTKIMTLFIFELALRLSEVLKIRWDDFNWSEWILDKEQYGKVNLRNTKRGKFRTLPVKPQLMSVLYDIENIKKTEEGIPLGGLVFDFGIDSYYKKDTTAEQIQHDYLEYAERTYREMLYKASKENINKRISPHYLRHSKSQQLLDNGMSLDALKGLLGHVSISSTEIYAQASPEKIKKEMKAYDIFKETQSEVPQDL